jgi:hypothetical protein
MNVDVNPDRRGPNQYRLRVCDIIERERKMAVVTTLKDDTRTRNKMLVDILCAHAKNDDLLESALTHLERMGIEPFPGKDLREEVAKFHDRWKKHPNSETTEPAFAQVSHVNTLGDRESNDSPEGWEGGRGGGGGGGGGGAERPGSADEGGRRAQRNLTGGVDGQEGRHGRGDQNMVAWRNP